jgi:RpiR family carbohydrate utilization transcriptional regulator
MLLTFMAVQYKKARKLARDMSLSARVALLSQKRQETIRPVFDAPRSYVLLSIRDLAKRLKTDPATMVRIVQGMKFKSYREFQHYLHELSIALATSLDTMQTTTANKFTVPAQVKASLEQDVKNLASFTNTIDARRITSVVRHLYAAKRIVFIAGDLAVNLVRFLEHHLNVLGLPVSSAISPGEIVHKMRHVGPKDVVLAVSFRRGLRPTVEGLRQAHANNAYCVVVTDSLLSPMAELADEYFLTMVETPSFGASYVAPIALFNAIVVACSNFRRSHTLALLKKVAEEQKHGSRWYEL